MKPFYSVIKSRQQKALLYAYWNSSPRTYFFFFPLNFFATAAKKNYKFVIWRRIYHHTMTKKCCIHFTVVSLLYLLVRFKPDKHWWSWSSLYSTLPILLLDHILYSKTLDVQTQYQDKSYSVLNGRKELPSVCDNTNFTL